VEKRDRGAGQRRDREAPPKDKAVSSDTEAAD